MDYLQGIEEIWSMVREKMSKKISATAVNLWFGNSPIVSFENNILTIGVDSEFKKSIVCEKYLPLIEETFEEFMGFHVSVCIEALPGPSTVEEFQRQIVRKVHEILGGEGIST